MQERTESGWKVTANFHSSSCLRCKPVSNLPFLDKSNFWQNLWKGQKRVGFQNALVLLFSPFLFEIFVISLFLFWCNIFLPVKYIHTFYTWTENGCRRASYAFIDSLYIFLFSKFFRKVNENCAPPSRFCTTLSWRKIGKCKLKALSGLMQTPSHPSAWAASNRPFYPCFLSW